jgi:hypothetical protein
MDERDLDVAVPVGAPLDERQSGQDPFGIDEVLSRGAGCLWCAVHGPGSFPVKAPVGGSDASAVAAISGSV